MKKLASFIAGCAALIGVAHADPPEGYAFKSYPEALHSAARSGKPVFLYLGRHGCGYCAKTNKESFSDADVRKRFDATFELAYVDSEGNGRLQLPSGERLTEAAFTERLNVVGTPVFFALAPDGSEIARVYGFQTAENFLTFREYVASGQYKTVSFRDYQAAGGKAAQ